MSFIEQYLEHLKIHVLKSKSIIDKQKSILDRYNDVFDALENYIKEGIIQEQYIQQQCSEEQLKMLVSILAVKQNVSQKLIEHTKELLKKSKKYARYSGLGTWLTIVPKSVQDQLDDSGIMKKLKSSPIVFVLRSNPNAYQAEMWIYKKNQLYKKFNNEYLKQYGKYYKDEMNEEHLLSILFKKVIIGSDDIIKMPLDDLMKKIELYFKEDLEKDLNENSARILDILSKINLE